MADKKENTNLFTSFKDVVNKVQKDVSLGVELVKLRNQLDGLNKKEEKLFTEFGSAVYKAHKGKKDTSKILDKYTNDLKEVEKEANALKKKIKALENKTAPAAKKSQTKPKKKEEAEKETEKKEDK